MKEQFYDLSIETLDDGTIRLEQRDNGESWIIDAHPMQLRHIVASLSGNPVPDAALMVERMATLERRLLWVRDRFDECHAALPSDMFERCPEAPEFYAWLQASLDVSAEFCADLAGASSIPPSNAQASPLEASSLPSEDGSLPSAAGCAGGLPGREADVHNGELFSET